MTKGEIIKPSEDSATDRVQYDPRAVSRTQDLLISRDSGVGGEGEVVVVDDFFGFPSY
jgi:hypothetical protein